MSMNLSKAATSAVKTMIFVATVAVMVLYLCGPVVQAREIAAGGGGIRGRNLGRTAIRATDKLVKGFRGLQSKGLCAGRNIFAPFPSYDYIKLGTNIADGRKACRRVCDAVKCPAFNYVPAGFFYPGNFWWMGVRYRATPECIIYHDLGMQLPGTHKHHTSSTKAFDFIPTTTKWFYSDWDWANGECFVSNWRESLNHNGGNERRLGLSDRIKKGVKALWRVVTGRGVANIREGAFQLNARLQKKARDGTLYPSASTSYHRHTGIPQLDNFVQGTEDAQGGYRSYPAGEEFDFPGWDTEPTSDAHSCSPTTFYEFLVNMVQKPIGEIVTQYEVDAYCWFYTWWMNPCAGPEEAKKLCDVSLDGAGHQWRVGQAFHAPQSRHIRPDGGIGFGADNEVYTVNPALGIHGSGNYGT